MRERIYGLDTGGYDSQKIAHMADWELFLEYYSITFLVWHMGHNTRRDYSKGYISKEEYDSAVKNIEELQYSVEYLLYTIAKQNNIKVNEPEVGKHIIPDRKSFMKWYSYYEDHFMHGMSDSTWCVFEQKRKDGADISEYLPDGDWRTYESK